MLDSALLRFDPWKKATCLRGHFAHTILRNHLLSENMQCGNYASFNVTLNYLMHEIMKSCMTSSLAFDNWEQKYCQTLGNKPNYSHCAARTIIFHFFLVCFPQCTLFFRKVCFLLPICLQCIICGSHVTKDKCCVVTKRAEEIRVAWIVYVRRYCKPIATLNQNKRTHLLYLGHAQIISLCNKSRFVLLL